MSDLGRIAGELRRSAMLADPRRLCERLGLLDGAKRQSGDGVIICCPAHGEKNPSCSVTRGPDGTVRCRCFSCDWTGDALTLIGVVTGRTAFAELVDDACDMVGTARPNDNETRGWVAPPQNGACNAVSPTKTAQPTYPDDIGAFWGNLGRLSESEISRKALSDRSIDPHAVERLDLARAIVGAELPRWASYQGEPWSVTGHVLVLPVFDADGEMRSVRAWRVIPGDSPKRLPPGGHKATGLVLANARGRSVLRGETGPCRVVLVEGEPDFLVWSTKTDDAVFGILSGAWTEEHAKRVPLGSTVLVRTHCDKAGDRYAEQIAGTLKGRGQIRRLVAA